MVLWYYDKCHKSFCNFHTDIDECQMGLDNCDANADCMDTDGSFTCLCHHGYSGDGTNCCTLHANRVTIFSVIFCCVLALIHV